MAYKYNPLIPLNLQKQDPAATPGDIDRLQGEIDTLTTNVGNKVPKIRTSITDIKVGEIGQKQDGSTADMTEGFFYKRGDGLPIVYEDITIPSGSKKIIYTNRFDASQQLVYAFDTIALPSSIIVNYSQQGRVYALDSTFHNNVINNPYTWILSYPSIIDTSTGGLIFSQSNYISSYIGQSFAISGQGSISEVQQCYQYVNDTIFYSGFRTAANVVATIGQISDFLLNIAIPIKKGDTEAYSYRMCMASDLLAVNWILSDYISQIYPLTPSPDVFAYDDTRPCYFYNNNVHVIIDDGNGNKFVLITMGASGQNTTSVYQTVSEDGEQTRFIDIHHLICVFDSQPVSSSNVWAQAIDADLYFNYTAEIVDTSESITIHRRIPHYDANGFQIVDKPAIKRVNAQPPTDPNALDSVTASGSGYLSLTASAKSGDPGEKTQAISGTLTVQPLATADNDHKGIAESSDVKSYVDTNTATATQGAKADTALQSISKGTDGDYITTTVSAKSDNSQTVASSLTLQPLATADTDHKGVAESSDVKSYINTNTATAAQGGKADTALQQVVHGTDGLYVTTTVTQKASNEQTIYTSLTLQDVETADDTHKGVAEASNVRKMFNIISAQSEAYGVMWDTANPSPQCLRIGNMYNHKTLPVQSQLIGGVMADDGTFTPFDNQTDWTQATQARDGSDGQVMIKIPQHWRKLAQYGTIREVWISPVELPGYVEIPTRYCGAYEASIERSTGKLCSVNNATADYRGGDNTSAWDGTYRTLLNRPVTNLNQSEFLAAARLRAAGTSWNNLLYTICRNLYWLFVTEYATLDSQADYNAALDANGFRQGGLGAGVTTWDGTSWDNFNLYNPFIPCGYLDESGNQTAVKNFSLYNADSTLLKTFSVNSYRGIRLPFGHTWKHTADVLINVESGDGNSAVYLCDNSANYNSSSVANYNFVCNQMRVDSYVKEMYLGDNADIFAIVGGGNSTSYYCDQQWCGNLPSSGSSLRCWLFGGVAVNGSLAGLACSFSINGPGLRDRAVGSRLCFVP